jgi:hypothetical protein
VELALIKELPPARLCRREVVREELRRCPSQQFVGRRGVELRNDRRVDLGHPLMIEDVVQHLVLVDVITPLHWFVQHHEKKAFQGLGKKQLEQSFAFEIGRK